MSKPVQEALAADTDAIPRRTVEWSTYRGKHLVRYKNASGVTRRCHTADYVEADAAFENWKAEMAAQAQGIRR